MENEMFTRALPVALGLVGWFTSATVRGLFNKSQIEKFEDKSKKMNPATRKLEFGKLVDDVTLMTIYAPAIIGVVSALTTVLFTLDGHHNLAISFGFFAASHILELIYQTKSMDKFYNKYK